MQNSKEFLTAVQQPESDIDIGYCALLIAQTFDPSLDVADYQKRFQQLTQHAIKFGVNNAESLLDFLHRQQGFNGNKSEYYTVDNSLLHKVYDERAGIPITLALIYIITGQCLQQQVYGISFPGHFLVGVKGSDESEETLIDAFAGRVVTRERCYTLIRRMYQREVEPDNRYFAAADSHRILLRVVENIKGVFLRQGTADKALMCLDYQLMIAPESEQLLKQQQRLLQHVQKSGDGPGALH